MLDVLANKTILITGGTGSFGWEFVKTCLRSKAKKIMVFSRDEMKQWEMANFFQNHHNLIFKIGDVRDSERLYQCMRGADYVIHAAATKIVPTAEYNPEECIRTNILGAMNVISASRRANVSKVVALSTDKASNPVNLYGATKLASDKLFVAANLDALNSLTYSVVRYGNVMGSRGSVIPFFLTIPEDKPIPITDKAMTRFMISLDEAVSLVLTALDDAIGGEIYVKKIPSMNILSIANAIRPNLKTKIIGIRPGEKLHEQMIGAEDALFTYEYKDYYKILPNLNDWNMDPNRIQSGKKVDENFQYTSDQNSDWMSEDTLRKWINKNKLSFIRI